MTHASSSSCMQTAPVTAGLLMTKHEAALQRILEEEIIREMDRESMLLKVIRVLADSCICAVQGCV